MVKDASDFNSNGRLLNVFLSMTRYLTVLPGGALEVTDCLVVVVAVGDCLILVRIVGGAVVVVVVLLLGVGVVCS